MSIQFPETDTIGIAVGTFGSDEWVQRARYLVEDIKENQTVKADNVVHVHGNTLAEARNTAAQYLWTDWVIFVDADDSLDVNYVKAMKVKTYGEEDALFQPSTLGVYPDGKTDDYSVLIAKTHLWKSNFLVIGTMCRLRSFVEVGGFRDYPVLEDWDLWIRMVINGAKVIVVPEAIYRVGVNEGSRNSNHKLHGQYYRIIRQEHNANREKLDTFEYIA